MPQFTRPFTDEEFRIMVSELSDPGSERYDMLDKIARKTLMPRVRRWCSSDLYLRGTMSEEDVMQEICYKLVKTTVNGFLKREELNGELNLDPDGFAKWISVVAKTTFLDFLSRFRTGYLVAFDPSQGGEDQIPAPDGIRDLEDLMDNREAIRKAFGIVIDSDNRVYKVLTWIAQSLFFIGFDITRIKSNDIIEKSFSDMTVEEMKDVVIGFARRIKWLALTPGQIEKIEKGLGAVVKGRTVGECKYKDFYMKKGGKATISDWVYRMDKLIASRMKRWNT